MGRSNKRTRRKADAAGRASRAADQEFVARTGSLEQQGPFAWELDRLCNDKGIEVLVDCARHRASDWATALGRIHCAYQLYTNGEGKRASDLLEENYEMLSNNNSSDDLIVRYHPALKHVLDSTWLRVRLEIDVPLPDGTSEEDVVKFSALEKTQQAAVWAIRAEMGGDEWNADRKGMRYGFIKRALDLNPNEGQWKYYLGNAMLRSRDGFGSYKDEISIMEDAYHLRQNPEIILGLASALMLEDTSHSKERCVKLTKQAMNLYPESPFVFLDCARIWNSLSGRFRSTNLAEECFRKALALAPDWMLAHLQFGSYCRSQGRVEEGLKHLRVASNVHEDAVNSLFPRSRRISEDDLEFLSYCSRNSPIHLLHFLLLHRMMDDMY